MRLCVRTARNQHPPFFSLSRFRTFWVWTGVVCLQICCSSQAATPDFHETEQLFLSGQYEECIQRARPVLDERFYREDWPILLTRSLLTVGKYPDALNVISNAMTRFRQSLRVRLLAHETFRLNGQTSIAKAMLGEINRIASSRRYVTDDAEELVAVGKAALLLGADARLVLENFFNQARKVDAKSRDAYLAIGELALEKGDFDLAAKNFQAGSEQFPGDADFLFGLAKAYAPDDRPSMVRHVDAALAANKRHIPTLLLLADHLIDAEEYKTANETLDKVFEVNPALPEGWAYRACIAHIRGDNESEANARQSALKFWKDNPEVDFIIGQKLSQKYRFREGSEYQRRALESDRDFLPAKIQLAQDLLRLGEEDEGWLLAEEVHKADGYDVVAYNLVTLRETISKFQVLTNSEFFVRMDPHEATVYGQRVMSLLGRARTDLCQRYNLALADPTVVEIFPEQKDFAVRTFGMPGGEGYLGVCFGRVITANSPASQQGNPSNWEAVLWHEFCHVVTLSLTKNKMPRWLSEGISVYEERKANPAWGQSMTARYREMILGDDLTPVSELSGAFLTPETPMHLQFAYYQSSLVVEFLVQRYGLEAIKRILVDLGEGVEINAAIEKHTAPMATIESEFKKFARLRAEELGPGLDWRPLDELKGEPDILVEKYPNNFYVLIRHAKDLIAEKKWQEAKAPLQKLLDSYPDQTGPESAYMLMAAVHRAEKNDAAERQLLAKQAVQDATALDAYARLMELATETEDWSTVAANAERFLAVNPLVPTPYRFLGRAHEALAQPSEAVAAYKTLLRFEPADLADVHFRLGRLLSSSDRAEARKHVLLSLEEAPRFRDAHKLLLTIVNSQAARPEAKPPAPPAPVPPVESEPGAKTD